MMSRYLAILFLLSFFLTPSWADQWVNPKEVINDPQIARLQGRGELTPLEREEVARYGFTGLEVMTYLEGNRYPGHDRDAYLRWVQVEAGGHIRLKEMLHRRLLAYRDILALITHKGIQPGEARLWNLSFFTYPPNERDTVTLSTSHLTTREAYKAKEIYFWLSSLRRTKRISDQGIEDPIFGGELTDDDNTERQPWHEDHRILGEDSLQGQECLVVESKNRLHENYYLSKRVTWVEKHNFIDLHEEQFDQKGRLWRVFDMHWKKFPPWNYWAKTQWNALDLSSGHRTLLQRFDFLFDQGLKKNEFSRKALTNTRLWRKAEVPPQPRGVSDLPPEPRVRWEFWSKLGIKPKVAKQSVLPVFGASAPDNFSDIMDEVQNQKYGR